MTTLDNSKLKRIMAMTGFIKSEYEHLDIHLFQAIWRAAQAEQREEDARICMSLCSVIEEPHEFERCAAAIRNSRGVK